MMNPWENAQQNQQIPGFESSFGVNLGLFSGQAAMVRSAGSTPMPPTAGYKASLVTGLAPFRLRPSKFLNFGDCWWTIWWVYH